MTHKVIILAEAAREAEAAYTYIAEHAPETAVDLYNRLLDAMFSLEMLPNRHPIAPESEFLDREARQLIYGNYRILYVVEDRPKVVRILHVRHGARRRFGEAGE
jgi:plasmid stabilization system protein ParE